MDIIACVHRNAIIPLRFHCQLPAARICIINHIIMHERSHMNQLKRHGNLLHDIQPVITEFPREQHKDRPNPLAASL
ncbi:hypothetical protein D3C80_1547730 [compost metagenome]